MENNIELNSIPTPKSHLSQIINMTGKCMAMNHCRESLFTFPLQYPNGKFRKKIYTNNKARFIQVHSGSINFRLNLKKTKQSEI